ncbi:NAD(P)-binding protein [Sodiomyces alkalinus F11]|uniref:NAD(P)-binding protein n=1 Tax=Sodiomyces alkalinus (strain CBS 110278 / VKM F-3762 / F11) TaxID=1314773 RepID=A0A3N2PUG1_SODAK|nr:NAD(P)-binding protein [Sodiomyces alkalinus F11]ROT38094.1 NAD(P)-binding protein [Sodiomyces alkalinus F11]
MSQPRSIAFLGATGGSGRSTLRHALAAGVTCTALCRTPSKLAADFPASSHPRLTIREGNAHSVDDVSAVLVDPSDPTRLVDAVSFSIGGAFDFSRMAIPDRDVCNKALTALLEALRGLRARGVVGRPRLSVVSTNGIADRRDFPLLAYPLYHYMLKIPHDDKRVMEDALFREAARGEGEEGEEEGEAWTIVRPSLLTDGALSGKTIRCSVNDPIARTWDNDVVGWTISREDVGKWMWENVLRDGKYLYKAVSITY